MQHMVFRHDGWLVYGMVSKLDRVINFHFAHGHGNILLAAVMFDGGAYAPFLLATVAPRPVGQGFVLCNEMDVEGSKWGCIGVK